jgi:hypothetical protein
MVECLNAFDDYALAETLNVEHKSNVVVTLDGSNFRLDDTNKLLAKYKKLRDRVMQDYPFGADLYKLPNLGLHASQTFDRTLLQVWNNNAYLGQKKPFFANTIVKEMSKV